MGDARAAVPTPDPDRYAEQLLSHLRQRTAWTTDGDISTAIAGGTGRVVVGDGMLTLIAEAPDAEALAQVQHVLGSHLERCGQRSELAVIWRSDAGGGAVPTPSAPVDHQRPGHHGPGFGWRSPRAAKPEPTSGHTPGGYSVGVGAGSGSARQPQGWVPVRRRRSRQGVEGHARSHAVRPHEVRTHESFGLPCRGALRRGRVRTRPRSRANPRAGDAGR
ncbi:DUF2218 domain-containing protein [Modestobacter altitudinis]|uniref:DUF2218 domain-containing protein n=1 Tax=Modestobacter altitudinis TaxID=2213158 RepID=UPI0034E0DFCB